MDRKKVLLESNGDDRGIPRDLGKLQTVIKQQGVNSMKLPGPVNVYKKRWKITMRLMGKSTFRLGHFQWFFVCLPGRIPANSNIKSPHFVVFFWRFRSIAMARIDDHFQRFAEAVRKKGLPPNYPNFPTNMEVYSGLHGKIIELNGGLKSQSPNEVEVEMRKSLNIIKGWWMFNCHVWFSEGRTFVGIPKNSIHGNRPRAGGCGGSPIAQDSHWFLGLV